MQEDRFESMKKYVQDHKNIKKELIDFGMLVLNLRVEDDRETIQELSSMSNT